MTGRKVTWHGANCGGVRENCAGGSCSLLIPGELKVTALKRNVFTTLRCGGKKNVNICMRGGWSVIL